MQVLLLAALLQKQVLKSEIGAVMRAQHISALSVGIERRGRPFFSAGYGLADRKRGMRARVGTVYRIGSLTKSFTAAAILHLAAQHRLSLSDSAGRWVPWLPWKESVSLAELLDHTDGLPSYDRVTGIDRAGSYTARALVGTVAKEPVLFPAGNGFAYGNTGYVILGTVIERASGQRFGTYLSETFLQPLGLDHTAFGDFSAEARGYRWNGNFRPVRPSSPDFAFSAAGLSANVPDLLRWFQQPASDRGMLQAAAYGYRIRYASGSVDGYSAYALVEPRLHDTIVILTNADAVDLTPLAKSLFAAIERPQPGTYAYGFSRAENEDPRTTAALRSLLERLRQGTVEGAPVSAAYAAALTPAAIAALRAQLPAPTTALLQLEYLGSLFSADHRVDRYRADFAGGVSIELRVGTAAPGTIDAFALEPAR